MQFIGNFNNLRLDIVGIVAILGEGSTSRNAQASALSWHHVLPRLYPAPQSLLRHHQEKRLPVESGIVVGALSGRVRTELNFFTQLLHHEDLPEFAVQLLEVERKPRPLNETQAQARKPRPAFGVKKFGHLAGLSILSCCMAITLLVLSIWQGDGPALMATLCLSFTSTFVGLASWCKLDVQEETPNPDRKGKVPLGDVVIFYPRTGAFRVIRCSDELSRLYFRVENCKHYFGDNTYRTIALVSTVLLMSGLIMLSNSQSVMQAAFAAAYVLLNVLYWLSSALNPATRVWENDFVVKEVRVTKRVRVNPKGLVVPNEVELPSLKAGLLIASETATVAGRSRQYHMAEPDRVETIHKIARHTDTIVLAENAETDWSRLWRYFSRISSIANSASDGADRVNSQSTRPPAHRGPPSRFRIGGVGPNRDLVLHRNQPTNMTAALWTAIALTGRSRWARTAHIAPDHEVWDTWLALALARASPRWSTERRAYVWPCMQAEDSRGNTWIQLPMWDCQKALKDLFVQYGKDTKQKYNTKHRLPDATRYLDEAWIDHKNDLLQQLAPSVIRRLRALVKRYRERKAREVEIAQAQSHTDEHGVYESKVQVVVTSIPPGLQ